MASWSKNLTKYTKSYSKRLEKESFTDEELMVFKTICLMSLNSIIYFVEAMKEGNPDYTGVKTKQWALQLKEIEEYRIHQIYEFITLEYFNETLSDVKVPKHINMESWRDTFVNFMSTQSEEHLVDKVFSNLYLDYVKRNEMTVMTFVEIFSSLFARVDVMLVKNIEQLNQQEK